MGEPAGSVRPALVVSTAGAACRVAMELHKAFPDRSVRDLVAEASTYLPRASTPPSVRQVPANRRRKLTHDNDLVTLPVAGERRRRTSPATPRVRSLVAILFIKERALTTSAAERRAAEEPDILDT
ncbi:hypothetical protein [Kribbella turkmenica]|uniref:hypothetical protein n=1 Tax=Kribbella turkmenica TaxID=2530375 RepID=UPI001F284EBB|nr:hypothetical protein [Kribbella turkmenica]